MKKDGFRHIFEHYHVSVLHVAYDVLQDHDLAQAVCEDVFVEFYEKMERIDERRIRGWILGNARRRADGSYRKRGSKRSSVEHLPDMEEE